jgi:hypothetical protein
LQASVSASALDRLHKKTRLAAETKLADGEEVITAFEGRSKQALIVTDRQILIVKPGWLAGAALGANVASFSLDSITAIHVHTGPGIAALEVVVAGHTRSAKSDLRAAYQSPNWLPCHRSIANSPLIAELRAFVQSGGSARSARAALGGSSRDA